jgi:hypothetical protein
MSFLEIFQPGLRHLREERERQKLMVARPPAAGRAPLGINLDAGTAVIPARPHPDPVDSGSAEPGRAEPAATEPGPPERGPAAPQPGLAPSRR